MPELLEQKEGEEEFDVQAAEREESRRLEGVAKEIDTAASFPVLFGIELITSLFNRPAKRASSDEVREEKSGRDNKHE